MSLSYGWFFCGGLEGAHCLVPHLVKVGAQPGHTRWIELVQPPRTILDVRHQARVFQHTQVLRYGGTAHWHLLSQLVDGLRAVRKLLKDGHARRIAQCVEPGL